MCKKNNPRPLPHTTHKYSYIKDQSKTETGKQKALMRATEETPQVKPFQCKPDSSSLVPRSHIKVERDDKVHRMVL